MVVVWIRGFFCVNLVECGFFFLCFLFFVLYVVVGLFLMWCFSVRYFLILRFCRCGVLFEVEGLRVL